MFFYIQMPNQNLMDIINYKIWCHTITINGITNEFIHLEYCNQDKLYVPVSSLNLVSRYTGADAEHAPLHRLGSGQWQKIRDKAEKRVFDVAAELLDLHAKRAARSGIAFTINQDEYSAFIQGFPFEETPDQEDAIIAVLEDMKLPKAKKINTENSLCPLTIFI